MSESRHLEDFTGGISEDRRRYVDLLREVHDDQSLQLALSDEIVAPHADVERLLFETEMLANYWVE